VRYNTDTSETKEKIMSYFVVEKNNTYFDHVMIKDRDENIIFGNYLNMTYDEMKSQKDLNNFVVAIMDAADAMIPNENDKTIITLIGEDDVFIWSIIMGTVDEVIRYSLVNWKADGKNYRYEPLDK
jgi:hypothetical protein